MSVRFAIIGCSKIARKHASSLARLADANLIAACDLDENRRKEFSEEFGVPTYADYHEMLEKEEVDAVTILTPTGLHAKHVQDVARYGKAIVVEKPMALRLSDADAMIEACDANKCRLFVVKQNRYNRPIQALRQALESGRFGKIVMGTVRVRWCRPEAYYREAPWRGTWAADGGVFTNQASHHIDMLEWMLGEPSEVSAFTRTALAPIEAEDTGAAIVRFRSGAIGVIEATTATRPKDLEGSISILGEKGSVVVGGFAMDKLVSWNFQTPAPEDESIFEKMGSNPPDFAWNHERYLEGVVQSLTVDGPALVDGLEGRRSLELINALYEASETERVVGLRFRPRKCRLGIPA